jgi:predicted membrane protein
MITVDERLLLILFFVLLSMWLTIILIYTKNRKLGRILKKLNVKKSRGAKASLDSKSAKDGKDDEDVKDSKGSQNTTRSKTHHIRTWK